MSGIDSRRFDLNLLRTLAVLLEERQVSRAAARLNRTQSAVSHALERLRRQLGDPLLVRRGSGMVPTAKAEELVRSVAAVLGAIDDIVKPATFDPATARGTLRIATTDYGSAVILPHVVRRLAAEAPALDVAYTDWSEATYGELETGTIDLALSGHESYRGMAAEKLFTERFVILTRADHPCIARPLTVDEYVRWPHIVVDVVNSRLHGIDRKLRTLGKKRTIGMRLPHFLAAPFLAQHSDLLVPVPQRLAALFASSLDLAIVDPPAELDLGRFDYVQMWNGGRTNDPRLSWLRDLVRRAVAPLAAEPPAPARATGARARRPRARR
jgi:DNA-binding transcriptional LysR family regulator